MESHQNWTCCTCSQTNRDPKRRRLVDAGPRGGGFRTTLVELFAFSPNPNLPYVCHICVTSLERVTTLQRAVEKKASERKRRIVEFDRMLNTAFPEVTRIQEKPVKLRSDSYNTTCDNSRSVKMELDANEGVSVSVTVVYTASVSTQTDGVVVVLLTGSDGNHSGTHVQHTSAPVLCTDNDTTPTSVPCSQTDSNVQYTSAPVTLSTDTDNDTSMQDTPTPVSSPDTDCDTEAQHASTPMTLTDIKTNVQQKSTPVQSTNGIQVQSTRPILPTVQNATAKMPSIVLAVPTTTSPTTLSQPTTWSTSTQPPVSLVMPALYLNQSTTTTGIPPSELPSIPTANPQTILSHLSFPMQPVSVNAVLPDLGEATVQPQRQVQPTIHLIQPRGKIQLSKQSELVTRKITQRTSWSLQKLLVLRKVVSLDDDDGDGVVLLLVL